MTTEPFHWHKYSEPISKPSIFQDEPCQFIEHILDRKIDFEYEFVNQYPSGFPTLAERYTECSEEIHVHLTVRDCKYCAVFYRPFMDEAVSQTNRLSAECGEINRCSDKVEMSVLLNVSKTIEQSQNIVRTLKVFSMVRLQLLNSCANLAIQSPLNSRQLISDAVGVPISRFPAQRESSFASGCAFTSEDQVPSKMIQDTAIVVQGVSKAEGNFLGRDSDLAINAPCVLQSFALEIVNNYTWLRLPEGKDFLPQGIHVRVRPYQLGLETVRESSHGQQRTDDELQLGISDSSSEVPESLLEIMRQNSTALADLTSKAHD